MDEFLTERARRGSFGRRRVAPRVRIFDPKPYIRIFLAEMFEDLGFIPQCCAKASEIVPSLDAGEPDLFVIVVSDDAAAPRMCSTFSPTELFCGRIILMAAACQRLPACSSSVSSLGSSCVPCSAHPFARPN